MEQKLLNAIEALTARLETIEHILKVISNTQQKSLPMGMMQTHFSTGPVPTTVPTGTTDYTMPPRS